MSFSVAHHEGTKKHEDEDWELHKWGVWMVKEMEMGKVGNGRFFWGWGLCGVELEGFCWGIIFGVGGGWGVTWRGQRESLNLKHLRKKALHVTS